MQSESANRAVKPIAAMPSDWTKPTLSTKPLVSTDPDEAKPDVSTNLPLPALLGELRETHRVREDYVKEIKSLTLRQCAMIRRITGCKKNEAPKRLKELFSASSTRSVVSTTKPMPNEGEEDHLSIENHETHTLFSLCLPFEECKALLKEHRLFYERRVRQIARQLPVWIWIEQSVQGVGDLGLGQIIAEAGDLSGYANPAKLWKRMGLGVIGTEAQRKHSDKQKALEHGYSPKRRAIMWNIGCSLIRLNDGKYRRRYDEYKEYQKSRYPEISDLHAHRRAQRVMEKEFLKDLWSVWNGIEPEDFDF